MIENMGKLAGNVSVCCDEVGISRQTHYRWLRENDRYVDEIHNSIERYVDIAESNLILNVQSREQRAIEYFLDSKGKSRGYGKNTLHVENTGTLHVTPSKEDYDKARKEMEEHFGSK